MDNFDIIGVLEAYAVAKGWHFVYGFDDFDSNTGVMKDYAPGELVLIADFNSTPVYKNGKITEITYNCLLMLGRKFDDDSTPSSMEETPKQKYDRRLKVLAQTLANSIAEIGCQNELETPSAPISVDINVYDTNLDFAISNTATFVQ